MPKFLIVKNKEDEVKICNNCNSVFIYNNNELFVEKYKTYDAYYKYYISECLSIRCPNCKEIIHIEEIRRNYSY